MIDVVAREGLRVGAWRREDARLSRTLADLRTYKQSSSLEMITNNRPESVLQHVMLFLEK